LTWVTQLIGSSSNSRRKHDVSSETDFAEAWEVQCRSSALNDCTLNSTQEESKRLAPTQRAT
jgi:hypothetical protein